MWQNEWLVGHIRNERRIKIFSQHGERIKDREGNEYRLSQLCDCYKRISNSDEAIELCNELNWKQRYCNHYQDLCKHVRMDASYCADRDCCECGEMQYLDYCIAAEEEE